MEVQILRYYLKVSSFFVIIFVYLFYIYFLNEIIIRDQLIIINKQENYKSIIDKNINDNIVNKFIYKATLKFLLINNIKIHYGHFNIKNKINFVKFIKLITSPSTNYEKISIIEGWTKYELNKILKEHFNNFEELSYTEVVADTYMFSNGSSFINFKKITEDKFNKIKEVFKNNDLLNKFSFKEIMIIGSLLEKEGLDTNDKKQIYSVIINRLNKKMKLQIDATVIYALTEGYKSFDRKLNYDDLKIKHNFNTYHIYGLPPEPISYVGYKTIELIFENYKTDYLFYFYNESENRHVFSKNYKNHITKLNEYRSRK